MNKDFYSQIASLLREARTSVVRNINSVMVQTYFEIGKRIVEEEQMGKARAEYGKELILNLSRHLQKEFGKGFSVDNLENMRRFYLTYSISETVSRKSMETVKKENLQNSQTLSADLSHPKNTEPSINNPSLFLLSWSHYQILIRMDAKERNFYEIETKENNWSVRELKRQYNSGLFERLALSKNKDEVKKLNEHGQIIEKPEDIIKDPYILEFTGLPEFAVYSESDLESALIHKLEKFLLELGKGFTFESRQKRISFDEKHFYIDLVFYNRILQCFVLLDLKIGELKHQDLGQMQMYVNYFDRYMKLEHENKTIGIILCKDKNEALVEITLPENNEQIYASRYKTVLPNKEELKHLLEDAEKEWKNKIEENG